MMAEEMGERRHAAAARWPSVSVVTATRDRPEFLRRSVAAALGQDYPGEIESVVVFDQSPVRPPEHADVPGRSLVTLSNERAPGLAGARNAGAAAASGELLAFCDDDDEWLPDKLRLQVEMMRRRPDAAAAACGIEVHYGDRTIPRVSDRSVIEFRDLLRSRRADTHPSTILTRREDFFGRIGPVDEDLPGSYAEDYEWLLRAARIGPIVTVRRPLVRVYWHKSSFFEGRWKTIASALGYLLDRNPEFRDEPRGLARILGQIAFAEAAAGEGQAARATVRRCLATSWREPRAFLALGVSMGVIRPDAVLRLAHRFGRGI